MYKLSKYLLLSILFMFCVLPKGLAQPESKIFGFAIADNKRSVAIPFTLNNNLIVVDVLFQGVIPLKFIIDTGVTNTVLIEKIYADVLDIVPDRKMSLVGAAGGKEVEAFIVNSISINLKGMKGSQIPLLILKEDYLKLQESMGIKVHGILGYDLFKNFIVKIDYLNRVLTFYNHDTFKKKLWSYTELPLVVENTKPYIYQTVKLNNSEQIKAKLMIDTGASHSLMLHQNSDSAIVVPEKNIRDILGAGIAGSIEGHVGRIDYMLIDSYRLDEVIARFPDVGTYNDIIENTERHGTVGGGVLRRFSTYLDYKNERLFIKKNKSFRESFDYDMSGMSVVAKGELFLEPFYEVDIIRAGTPADKAGLKSKDIILSLNGYQGKALNLSRINEILTSKEGRKIRVKIQRNKEVYLIEFRLEKFI